MKLIKIFLFFTVLCLAQLNSMEGDRYLISLPENPCRRELHFYYNINGESHSFIITYNKDLIPENEVMNVFANHFGDDFCSKITDFKCYSRFSDYSLNFLAEKFINLRSLDLSPAVQIENDYFSKEGIISFLKKCRKIEDLNFYNCKITNKEIRKIIVSSTQLRIITLPDGRCVKCEDSCDMLHEFDRVVGYIKKAGFFYNFFNQSLF